MITLGCIVHYVLTKRDMEQRVCPSINREYLYPLYGGGVVAGIVVSVRANDVVDLVCMYNGSWILHVEDVSFSEHTARKHGTYHLATHGGLFCCDESSTHEDRR